MCSKYKFFIKAFTRTNASAHWQKQPKWLPNIFEGTEGKPSQVHSSCAHSDPWQGTRQTVTEEDPCISSSSSLTSPTLSCYSYHTGASWGVTTLQQITQKTDLLDKSPVLEMQNLDQPNPPEDHLQPLSAKVMMRHCWQGQRTLNAPQSTPHSQCGQGVTRLFSFSLQCQGQCVGQPCTSVHHMAWCTKCLPSACTLVAHRCSTTAAL